VVSPLAWGHKAGLGLGARLPALPAAATAGTSATFASDGARACHSYEWVSYCYRSVLAARCLVVDFEKIVSGTFHFSASSSVIICVLSALTSSIRCFLSFPAKCCSRCNVLFVAILVMFAEPQPAVRARVVKTLALLTKADPSLIARPSFTDAVTERFNDVAISVREEAVKLVGGFVTKARQSFNAPSFPSFGAPYLLHPIQTR
jgi:hypothetical protein